MRANHIRQRLLSGLAGLVVLCMAAPSGAEVPELEPVTDDDYYWNGSPDPALVELGRLLFYDKVLSGNRNISCASCHHPAHETGDGLAVSMGEGATGLGPERDTGAGAAVVRERIPRNAQPLFNLGAKEFTRLFHDGRVEVDERDPSRILTPVGEGLPARVANVLAAQALFPVLSVDEMAGQPGENDVSGAVTVADVHTAWARLEKRIRSIPGYVERMQGAFDHVESAADVSIVEVANAIAAFTTVEWRADESPFDAWLRGDESALDAAERRGMALFYGKASCAECHSGVFQTDHEFHAIAMPQIGPGKGHGFDGHDDFGREAVTGRPADRYRFRTPSLRNVTATGPWGHAGAYETLEAVVRHHLDPVASLERYAMPAALKPARPDLHGHDFLVMSNPARRAAIAARNELEPVALSDGEVDDLIAFLGALTDPGSLSTDENVPEAVPSGLPVED